MGTLPSAAARHHATALADFIPYSSHLDDTTLITRDGALLRIFRVGGFAFDTKDGNELAATHTKLNNLLRSLRDERVTLWSHVIRRKVQHPLSATFENTFAQQLDTQYQALLGDDVLVNELYVTVLQQDESIIGRVKRTAPTSPAKMKALLQARLAAFDHVAGQVRNHFHAKQERDNMPDFPPLGIEEHEGRRYSQPLTFLNFLLSGEWSPVPEPHGLIHDAVGDAWVTVQDDVVTLQGAASEWHLAGLDIKEYPLETHNGLLDRLLYVPYAFILTQSFALMPKTQGEDFLIARRRTMSNAGDGAYRQIAALDDAVNDLKDGHFCMGEYHFSLMVMDQDREAVRKHRTHAIKVLSDCELLAVPVRVATDATFFAQLPGNWRYRPRVVGVTSQNFASLSPFHNFLLGTQQGNPWGQAVTRLQTPSGQPYFFNFHYTRIGENNFNKKIAGNTRMFGMTGSGKTVALGLLYCQAQKYRQAGTPFSTVFFDKDRGAEVMIRALGGRYLRLKNGEPTGFNPFQMAPTPENITFLVNLVKHLVTPPDRVLEPMEMHSIDKAVNTVMRLPQALRRLSMVNQNIAVGTSREEQRNSIKLRLARWCAGGALGWVFDNPTDQLDFNVAPNIGIDGTAFLDNDEVRTPISLYLLHRMEEVIDGRRFCYVMDEAWKWVNDPAFAEFVGNKQLTIRKQNGFGIFATQMPESLLNSPQGAALIAQCTTEIYLPNPKATREVYVEQLGLTEKEFALLCNLDEKSRMCLIKQGGQSVLCSLNMPGMNDVLTVLSAGTDELPLFESAVADAGDDPARWLPLFLQRVNAEHARKKAQADAMQGAAPSL